MTHQERYDAQAALPKSMVAKLAPGAWIEVKWRDAPNTIGLVLTKLSRGRGEQSLSVWNAKRQTVDDVINTQVIHTHGLVEVPMTLAEAEADAKANEPKRARARALSVKYRRDKKTK